MSYAGFEHLADVAFKPGVLFCVQAVHFYLQQSGYLRRMINSAKKITLITGRNIIDRFSAAFPGAPVQQFLIPAENLFRLKGEEVGDRSIIRS